MTTARAQSVPSSTKQEVVGKDTAINGSVYAKNTAVDAGSPNVRKVNLQHTGH